MPGSCESLPGIGGVAGAGGGASSQFAHQLRVVRGGKNRQSEFNPEANVAKVASSGASSKGISNL